MAKPTGRMKARLVSLSCPVWGIRNPSRIGYRINDPTTRLKGFVAAAAENIAYHGWRGW
jgi:hypothetical protein